MSPPANISFCLSSIVATSLPRRHVSSAEETPSGVAKRKHETVRLNTRTMDVPQTYVYTWYLQTDLDWCIDCCVCFEHGYV